MGRRNILQIHIRGDKGAEGIRAGGYVTPVVDATMRL